jgi:hypothetical protein
MKYIKKLQLNFNSFQSMQNELKKIEIDYISLSDIKFNKNKKPDEIIKEYNNYITEFPNIKNIESQLSRNLSYIFDDIIKKIIDNLEEYSLEYIKNTIISESEYSVSFLIQLAKKHRDESLEKRLEVHQKIKKDFQEYYKNLFDKNKNYLFNYIHEIKVDDKGIEDFLIKENDLHGLVSYYMMFNKPRSNELEKKLLNGLVENNEIKIHELELCTLYCFNIIKNYWSEFEKKLIDNNISNVFCLHLIGKYLVTYNRKLDILIEKILNIKYDQYDSWNKMIFFEEIRNLMSQKLISQLEEFVLNQKQHFQSMFVRYSKYFLKKRWIEHEDKLFDYNNYDTSKVDQFQTLIDYIKFFKIRNIELDQRFINVFKKSYKLAYNFCFALKKAIPELEPTIAKSYSASFNYATKVLNARFPLGEKKILKSRKAQKYIQKFNL